MSAIYQLQHNRFLITLSSNLMAFKISFSEITTKCLKFSSIKSLHGFSLFSRNVLDNKSNMLMQSSYIDLFIHNIIWIERISCRVDHPVRMARALLWLGNRGKIIDDLACRFMQARCTLCFKNKIFFCPSKF